MIDISPLVKGKTLLVLGGDADTVSLVKRAKNHGCKVIVADYYTDPAISPCKSIADEAWDISWTDIDALAEASREAGVDGVMAGYSEPRIESMIQLTGKLGLPCYSTMSQLDITRNKVKFKEACRLAGVPVVREYARIEDVDLFPVIVKPVDRGGSIGVGIAHNKEELRELYNEAVEASFSGEVIIEDFIQDGIKVDFYYDIIEGVPVFLGGSDVIFASSNGSSRVVQSAWPLPSKFQDEFEGSIDPAVRKFIEGQGIKNGYIFISGFRRSDGSFVFFECGFRLCGGHLYNVFEKMGFPNTLDLFILTALCGTAVALGTEFDVDRDLKYIDLNYYCKEGQVQDISGFDKAAEVGQALVNIVHAHIGQECSEDKAILSKLGMLGFCSHDPNQLGEDVRIANATVTATSSLGQDLIYDRVDPKLIASWWS